MREVGRSPEPAWGGLPQRLRRRGEPELANEHEAREVSLPLKGRPAARAEEDYSQHVGHSAARSGRAGCGEGESGRGRGLGGWIGGAGVDHRGSDKGVQSQVSRVEGAVQSEGHASVLPGSDASGVELVAGGTCLVNLQKPDAGEHHKRRSAACPRPSAPSAPISKIGGFMAVANEGLCVSPPRPPLSSRPDHRAAQHSPAWHGSDPKEPKKAPAKQLPKEPFQIFRHRPGSRAWLLDFMLLGLDESAVLDDWFLEKNREGRGCKRANVQTGVGVHLPKGGLGNPSLGLACTRLSAGRHCSNLHSNPTQHNNSRGVRPELPAAEVAASELCWSFLPATGNGIGTQ
ncbi:hypothetical protein BDK51DRAFT_40819 [Blyttiomyces helicus]|uniref:Uncharacterized protein n=1 Tax=Blyttiomyces helicus TaxID=388810 RepID=A0A4P9WD60_9FUNG|nr:hypothetical protein BDK51DRAFT_40819 [Blyttiomyces helicus]|eukprot:RKO90611.1 hypothetical protein BDK51DRAFT_40819 [Blyttiomyces helicus]